MLPLYATFDYEYRLVFLLIHAESFLHILISPGLVDDILGTSTLSWSAQAVYTVLPTYVPTFTEVVDFEGAVELWGEKLIQRAPFNSEKIGGIVT